MNVASLSGNYCFIKTYVDNFGLSLKVRTIEQKLMDAESARFKAECSLLHIHMFGGSADSAELQLI
jgi:hypothetical protein